MAIARQDHNQTAATTATSATCAFSTSAAISDLIVVWARLGSGTASSTISDNLSNTYTKIPGSEILTASFARMVMAYSAVTTAGTPTITVAGDVSSTIRIAVARYNGFVGTPTLDQFAQAASSGTVNSASSGNIITTVAAEVMCGYYAGNGGSSTATDTGGTTTFETVNVSKLLAADAVISSTGSHSASWSLSPSETANTEAMIASFYDSFSGPAPPVPYTHPPIYIFS